MTTAYLDGCTSMLGKLSPDCAKRLQEVIAKPTRRTWDKAYSIIINGNGEMITLWQAWIAVDPSAPRTGKSTDQHGKVIQGWVRIPDQLTLYRALRYATKGQP